MQNQQLDPRLVRIGIIALFILVIGGVAALALGTIFRKNPYGDEVKVDNFSSDLPGVSADRRDQLFAALYTRIQAGLPEGTTIPKNGAKIRSGSVTTTQNPQTQMMESDFIIDIESVQRSYGVHFEWSPDKDNTNFSGYPLVLSCLPESKLIYGPFDCITDDPGSDASASVEAAETVPEVDLSLYQKLPVNIEYYDSANRNRYVHYRITGFLTTTKEGKRTLLIKIYDYSGKNYELALARIRKLGYNPNDYLIEYIDQSSKEGHSGI